MRQGIIDFQFTLALSDQSSNCADVSLTVQTFDAKDLPDFTVEGIALAFFKIIIILFLLFIFFYVIFISFIIIFIKNIIIIIVTVIIILVLSHYHY